MCCFVGPARTSKTTVYAGEVSRLGVHVVAYQNTVGNGRYAPGLMPPMRRHFFSQVEDAVATANAMIIHFPAAEAMGPENMIDASDSPGFLDDIRKAIPDPNATRGMTRGGSLSYGMKAVQIFDKGSYKVVLASDASHIPDALELLPSHIRPPFNNSIFYAYSEWFPGWPVALCCFNNTDDVKVEPLLWWYKPRNPNVLFVPTLDAHDGSAPDLDSNVELDHTIAFGSDRMTDGFEVRYGGPITPEVKKYLPEVVVGDQYNGDYLPNGDFTCDLEKLNSGKWYRYDEVIKRADPRQLVQMVG
jgi:hypothetical protein